MSAQEARERPHRERAMVSVRGARCADCHRLILDTSTSVYAIWRRRVRVCMDCVRRDDPGAVA